MLATPTFVDWTAVVEPIDSFPRFGTVVDIYGSAVLLKGCSKQMPQTWKERTRRPLVTRDRSGYHL